MRVKIPAGELLTYIEIKDGVLRYTKRIPNCRMEAGDAVTVAQCNGKPHYQIMSVIYDPRKLIQAVQNQDPTYLIERSAKPKRITARDLEMYEMLKRGETYVDVGARYDLSRQRVKQIINKLSSNGYAIDTLQTRRDRRAGFVAEVQQSKYGDNYKAIMANPQLFAYMKHRLSTKRSHALANGIEFDITISDIYPLPEVCPVLGIPIEYGVHHHAADNTLSIDRIDPNKGYVKGNVIAVSMRANRIKNDATIEELYKIADFYSKLTT